MVFYMEKSSSSNLKKSILTFLYLLVFLALLTPLESYAAAWVRDRGEGLLIANVQQYTSERYWDKQGHLHTGPRYNQFSLNPYFEYGACSNLTIGISPSFYRISQARQVSTFGLNNVIFFGRFLVQKKDWSAFSIQLSYNQPCQSGQFGNAVAPSALTAYGLISRQRYLDVRLLFGTGGTFDKEQYNTWYADFEGAYRPNFNGAADELHFDMMLGLKTLDATLIFELKELNTISLNNPSNPTKPDYNLVTIIPNIQYWFTPNMAIQLGLQQDVYGTNIGRGTAPFVALWVKL